MYFYLLVNLACNVFPLSFSFFESWKGMGKISYYCHFFVLNFVDFVRKVILQSRSWIPILLLNVRLWLDDHFVQFLFSYGIYTCKILFTVALEQRDLHKKKERVVSK